MGGAKPTKLEEWRDDTKATKASVFGGVTVPTGFRFGIPVVEGENQSLHLCVTDLAGNYKEYDYTKIAVDFSRPTIGEFTYNALYTEQGTEKEKLLDQNGTMYVKNDERLQITTTVFDTYKIGVDNITVTKADGTAIESSYITKTPVSEKENNEIEIKVIIPASGNDGSWALKVVATDAVRSGISDVPAKTRNAVTKSATIDAIKPTLANDFKLKDLGDPKTKDDFSTKFFNTTALTFVDGTITENGTGISELKYYIGNSVTPKTQPLSSNTLNNVDLTGFSEGSNALYLEIYDKAGNFTRIPSTGSYTISVDMHDPSVTLEEPTSDKAGTLKITSSKGDVYFIATVEEGNLDTVKFTVTPDASSDKSVTISTFPDGDNGTRTIDATNTEIKKEKINETYKYTITQKFAAGDWADANYKVIVEAEDKADRSGSSFERSFLVDRKAPVITITNLNESAKTDIYGDEGDLKGYLDTDGNKYALKGTWSDVDGSGTKALYYAWGTTEPNWATMISSYTANSAEFGKLDVAEGVTTQKNLNVDIDVSQCVEKDLYLYVIDNADNPKQYKYPKITIDYAKPTIEDFTYEHGSSMYVKSDEKLKITTAISDSHGIEVTGITVKTTTTKEGDKPADITFATSGALVESNGLKATATKAADGKITVELEVDATAGNAANNGKWQFEIEAKDKANRISKATTKEIIVDTVPPTFKSLSLDSVAAATNVSGETANQFTDKVFGNSYVVAAGTANDLTSGSGVSRIEYKLNGGTSTPITLSKSGEDYSFSDSTILGLAENDNTLLITPYDNAGNVGSTVKYQIKTDFTPPSVTLDEKVTNGVSLEAITAAKNNAKFTATIDESSKLSSVVFNVYKKDGKTLKTSVSLANVGSLAKTDGVYKVENTFDVSDWDDETYKVQVVATDVAGKVGTSETVSILVDKSAPVVAITNLNSSSTAIYGDEGDLKGYLDTDGNKYTIKGTWSDANGSGTKALYYAWGTTEPDWATKISTYTTNNAEFGKLDVAEGVTSEKSINTDVLVSECNNQNLYLYVIDNADNSKTFTYSDITIDYAKPTIGNFTYTGTTENTMYVKQGNTLKVTTEISDSHGIEVTGIKVATTTTKAGDKPAEITFVTSGGVIESNGLKAKATKDADGKITVELEVSAADATNDGDWKFTVTATDASSRISTATTTEVTIDATPPVLKDGITIDGNKYEADNYYRTEDSLKIGGEITESGSGVDNLSLTLTPSGDSSALQPTTISPQSTFSTIIAGFKGGIDNNLVISIVDKAGNVTNVPAFTIKVDYEGPEFSNDMKINNLPVQSTMLTSGNEDYVITGTVTDNFTIKDVSFKVGTNGTEIKAVDLTEVSPAPASGVAKAYSVTIPKTSLADGAQIIAYVTDEAGNKTPKQPVCTLSIDKEPPTYKITSDTSGLNGTDEIKGSTSDDKTLQSITLYYTLDKGKLTSELKTDAPNLDGQSGWEKIGSFTTVGDANQITEVGNWLIRDFNFSTKSGVIGEDGTTVNKPDGKATMYVLPVVIDEAGNSNAYEIDSDGKYNWKFNGYNYDYTYNNSKNVSVNVKGTTKGAVEFNVDLNADRPVIKFTNLRETKVLKSGTDATIEGDLNDDDGAATMFIVSSTQITPSTLGNYSLAGFGAIGTSTAITSGTNDGGDYTITGIGGEKTMYNPTSGQWKFTPANKNDGNKTMYFYVVDENGTVFYTGKTAASGSTDAEKDNANGLYNPRLQYQGSNEKFNNWGVVGYNSDSHNPTISSVKASWSETGAGSFSAYDTYSATTAFGGKEKRFVNFEVAAEDANGIKKIEIKVTDAAGNEILKGGSQSFINAETTNGDISAKWQFGYYDLSEASVSGPIKVVVTATDQSDMYSDNTTTFYCDNEVDMTSFNPTSPSKTETQTGAVKVAGTALENNGSGIQKIEWLIPKKDDVIENINGNETGWTETNVASLPTWEFNFGATKDDHPSLFDYLNETYFDMTTSTGIFKIRMLFKVTDKLGNTAIYRGENNEGYAFEYMPDANLPKTDVSYPTGDASKFLKVGRNIRITGSAVGNIKASKVYVQLLLQESKSGGSTVDPVVPASDAWGSTATGTLATMLDSDNLSVTTRSGAAFVNYGDFGETGHFYNVDSNWWGIQANGTTSWNLTVNQDSTLEDQYLWIRACAVIDEDDKDDDNVHKWVCGPWSEPQLVQIDAGTPQVGNSILKLVTYDETGSIADNQDKVKSYSDYRTEDITYISRNNGNLYLAVSAEDDAGIKSVKVKKQIGNASTDIEPEILNKTYSCTEAGKSDKLLYIRLDTDVNTSDGKVSYIIDATEDTEDNKMGSLTCTFYVDNAAPTLSNIQGNKTDLVAGEASNNRIKESNSRFILSGKSTELGSGIERILFFFHRGDTTFLDPVWTNKAGWSKAASKVTGLDVITITQGGTAYKLYGKANVAGSHPTENNGSTTTVFANQFKPNTAADITGDIHIKLGGLICIGGKLWRITEIASDGTVTFDGSTGIVADTTEASNLTASFIYGQSIDTQNKESLSNATSEVFGVENDDDDFMAEGISGTASSGYDWDATIHSNNIPDGPAALEILAFDKAGNISSVSYNVYISNNAPRIAKLHLGTDLNGNGEFSDAEFETYNFIGVEGGDKESMSFATAKYKTSRWDEDREEWQKPQDSNRKAFTIKNNLAVVSEFVGGNGEIKVVFNNNSADNETVGKKDEAGKTFNALTNDKTTGTIGITTTAEQWGTAYTNAAYVFENTALGDQGENRKMSFTFWDSTEEMDQGTTTQSAFIRVTDFHVKTTDTTEPNVVVNKFFWNNKSENSLYGNSTANGHIELENDLTDALNTSPYTNGAPKVSGKIVVRGTAYDDVCLNTLSVKFGTIDTIAATYMPSDETWTINAPTTLGSAGWTFKVYRAGDLTDDIAKKAFGTTDKSTLAYFGQDGHKVAWELTIDTETVIATKAAANQKLTVTATDIKTPTANSSSTRPAKETGGDTEMHRQDYTMDVVPYITSVTTDLSMLDESFPTAHSRSALGRYTVRTDETVTISGFNLKTGATVSDEDGTTADSTLAAGNKIAIGALKSGKITVTVEGIPTINNKNNNDAKGSYDKTVTAKVGDKDIYDNYYNRQPNGYNNNRLTDDLEFAVWQFNSEAVKPKSGMAIQPIMKIEPKSGVIGFAFIDGPLWFSMPYGRGGSANSTSYERWVGSYDFFTSVGMTYDDDGYAWAVAAGGDINDNAADTYSLASSRWGTSDLGKTGIYNGNNLVRLDRIGVNNGGSKTWLKQRFKSSTLTTAKHGNQTNVYLAYYDALVDEVRFKAGEYTNGNTSTQFSAANSTYFKDNKGNTPGATITNETQAIAKGKTGTRGAGQYVCLAVVPGSDADNDVVVAVWWDSKARTMRYAYNTTPLTVEGRAGDTTGTGWTYYENVFSGRQARAGEYCQIAVDSKGGIHIAAYDSQNLDVVYAYSPSYNGTFSTCTVDSSGVVGEKLTLDVALDVANGNAIPYIGYYATSSVRPKYAYKVLVNAAAPSGAESDKVTGDWESIVVPTSSAINHEANGQHNKINIGVWKNGGVLADSKAAPNTDDIHKGAPGNHDYNGEVRRFGYTYGNGTKNAVLGYAIEVGTDGYLETAQMK